MIVFLYTHIYIVSSTRYLPGAGVNHDQDDCQALRRIAYHGITQNGIA